MRSETSDPRSLDLRHDGHMVADCEQRLDPRVAASPFDARA
jgi:hypothetical protein